MCQSVCAPCVQRIWKPTYKVILRLTGEKKNVCGVLKWEAVVLYGRWRETVREFMSHSPPLHATNINIYVEMVGQREYDLYRKA